MKAALVVVGLLALGCSKSSNHPAMTAGGGGLSQDGGSAAGGDNVGSAAGHASGGASESGAGGVAMVPPDNYDDSGCEHPALTKDCSGGWCKVPPGCFIMGSPEHEWGHPRKRSA